ncbi:MAG: hypothetical protein ACJA09_003018 [Alcanivorax sp.]|jgi:hypothetical protein
MEKRLLEKLIEYYNTAIAIGSSSNSNSVIVLFRLLACRSVYGFGPKDYLLFNFHSKPFAAAKHYLAKDELEVLQAAVNPEHERYVVADKLHYYLHCKEHSLPTPEILALTGLYQFDIDLKSLPRVTTVERLKDIVSQYGEGCYLLKPIDGSHGDGLIRFELENGLLVMDGGRLMTADKELQETLTLNTCFILQRFLRPHPQLKPIMPGASLGTARLVTLNHQGQISVIFGCIKIPAGNNVADNFVAGSMGNLLADVDLQTGTILKTYGPDLDHPGVVREVSIHPDSGVIIPGFVFPHWNAMLDAVITGAQTIPQLGTIGWDIALTEDGPCLIEANSLYACDILQTALGRGLKPDFERVLDPINLGI